MTVTCILDRLLAKYSEIYENIEPCLRDLPFMSQPFTLIGIILAYLYFIYRCGPKFMLNRKPYDIRKTLLIYNGLQVIINTVLLIYGIWASTRLGCPFACIPISEHGAYGSYLYFLNKLFDLVETFMFVLRKKYSQISVLHVYHHVAISLGTYASLILHPGGHGTMLGLLNTFVHAIMYMYYLLTIYDQKTRMKFERYKIRLTQLQMAQFIILIIHFGYPLVFDNCDYSKTLSAMVVVLASILTGMFVNFYYRSYGWRWS